jgi:pilus assembly protein Flp/PilA
MTYISCRWRATLRSERGATAVEYALMAALIALVIISAVIVLGGSVNAIFQDASIQI